jgi:AcrR family transcriptional regulator
MPGLEAAALRLYKRIIHPYIRNNDGFCQGFGSADGKGFMGHRADLLDGAKRCLSELGYARTTARDLVKASGTNLASIGYHFGSKEALLNEAMVSAIEDWRAEFGQALAAIDSSPDRDPVDRFVATWSRIIESFRTHRQLWIATIEALAQAERSPEVRAFLGEALQAGRDGLPALFTTDATRSSQQAVGSLYQALMTGVGVQWLIDPERAPSARDLAAAIQAIALSMGPPGPATEKHRRRRPDGTLGRVRRR